MILKWYLCDLHSAEIARIGGVVARKIARDIAGILWSSSMNNRTLDCRDIVA